MVVRQHAAWAEMPDWLQKTDAMLTAYLNSIPPLGQELFEPDELAVIGAYAAGEHEAEIHDVLQMPKADFLRVRREIGYKMGVKRDSTIVYRACASGFVEYEPRALQQQRPMSPFLSIVLKARAGDYSEPEIVQLIPGTSNKMIANQKKALSAYFDARTVVHAVTCAFAGGLFARDVKPQDH